VFPYPEPKAGQGSWSGTSPEAMRKYLAIAPRGQTIEYALDRMIVSLQTAIRRLIADPVALAVEIGIDACHIDFLVRYYGTDVIYGKTPRDLDAVVRSGETRWEDVLSPRHPATKELGRSGEQEAPADCVHRCAVQVPIDCMSAAGFLFRFNLPAVSLRCSESARSAAGLFRG